MIGGLRSIVGNLSGATLLMLGRPEGLDRLDISIDGFWRSFAAVVLVAPFAYLSLLSQLSLDADPAAPSPSLTGGLLTLSVFTFLVDWIAFPALFALLARPFGLASRYVPFIVARNWASVVTSALMATVNALHLIGALSTTAMLYAALVATVLALRFSYCVTRLTLAVAWPVALPVVVLDFLVSLIIWTVYGRLT